MPKPRCILIAGFLGAGKTTAMLRLAGHLAERGRRVGLITNDQGAGLVDTTRVRAAGYPGREITGGCFCCRFDSLVAAAQALSRETAPDVLIAEPVGSCTDIQATVAYPLRRLYGQDYDIAPLSVLVDPHRCARILGLEPGPAFTEKVRYIYRKQLEEAELLVVNKIDLLDMPARQRLVHGLHALFPQARVVEVSCATGEGLAAWFDALLTQNLGTRPVMEVDYDTYAQGEALLGWLNATVRLAAPEPFDGNALLAAFAETLRQRLAEKYVEIAHLKMTLIPEEGPDMAVVSVTRTDAAGQMTHRLQAPLAAGELGINLRAQADPEVLRGEMLGALAGLGVAVHLETLNAFRPGRPEPTHRLA